MVMDRIRRSLRDSFRRKKEHVPECSKPHQWQSDEHSVKAGTCCFGVKYLGGVEVFESRGMQVCEDALKVLRSSRRRPTKGVLYVTGDGLRVVDDDTKGLIVDQTIEKVSFCAPDRGHERGFSYICRDGTTRRWMCHGFLAIKDSGERLSHAVGCAFAACLDRKQRRDKELGVTMSFDTSNSTFTRTGSFRQTSLTERMVDPQECKPVEPKPVKAAPANPFAVDRPHATPLMLQRQGSFRGFVQLNQTSSPFKRQLSLRLGELPSNLERQRAHEAPELSRNNLMNGPVLPIPETQSSTTDVDSIAAMCQRVTQGLSLLSSTGGDPFNTDIISRPQPHTNQPPNISSRNHVVNNSIQNDYDLQARLNSSNVPLQNSGIYSRRTDRAHVDCSEQKLADAWLDETMSEFMRRTQEQQLCTEQGNVNASAIVKSTSNPTDLTASTYNYNGYKSTSISSPNATNGIRGSQQHRSMSVSGSGVTAASVYNDPFDAEWAALAASRSGVGPVSNANGNGSVVAKSTNPFQAQPGTVKAFEVHL